MRPVVLLPRRDELLNPSIRRVGERSPARWQWLWRWILEIRWWISGIRWRRWWRL
ncbi:hypothetical protein LINPERHAP2_LOCUS13802 [Linum perenne]